EQQHVVQVTDKLSARGDDLQAVRLADIIGSGIFPKHLYRSANPLDETAIAVLPVHGESVVVVGVLVTEDDSDGSLGRGAEAGPKADVIPGRGTGKGQGARLVRLAPRDGPAKDVAGLHDLTAHDLPGGGPELLTLIHDVVVVESVGPELLLEQQSRLPASEV